MPTGNYHLFRMAEEMHIPVGQPYESMMDMLHVEYVLWNRYQDAKGRLIQQQGKKRR